MSRVASLRTNLLIMSHEWSQLGLCFHFTFVPCTATPPCMIQFAGRGFLIMSCQLKQCIVLSPIHSGTLMATIDPKSVSPITPSISSLYPHPDWLIILYPKVFRILKHCAGLHDYYAASSHDTVSACNKTRFFGHCCCLSRTVLQDSHRRHIT